MSEEARVCDCKRDRSWVRFPLKKMKYLIFSFLHSVVEAMRGVECRPSTINAFRIRRKLNTRCPLLPLMNACYSVTLRKVNKKQIHTNIYKQTDKNSCSLKYCQK